jgi:hypothetical protein
VEQIKGTLNDLSDSGGRVLQREPG